MITQRELGNLVGVSTKFINCILSGKQRPGRMNAQKLEEVTGIDRMIWLYGTTDEIKQRLEAVYGPKRSYKTTLERVAVLESELDRIIELLTQKQEQQLPGGNHETA